MQAFTSSSMIHHDMPHAPVIHSSCEAQQLGLCIHFMGKIMREFQLRAWVHDVTGDATSITRFVFLGNGLSYDHCASPDVLHSFLSIGAIWARGILAHVMPWIQPWSLSPYGRLNYFESPSSALLSSHEYYMSITGKSSVCSARQLSYDKLRCSCTCSLGFASARHLHTWIWAWISPLCIIFLYGGVLSQMLVTIAGRLVTLPVIALCILHKIYLRIISLLLIYLGLHL